MELLVILAIASLLASMAGAGVRAGSPSLRVRHAAADLEQALKSARVKAETKGVAVEIRATADGFIGAEGEFVPLRRVTAKWRSDADGAIVFQPSGFAAGAEIRLQAGEAERRVVVDPLTGRVHVEAR